MWWPPDVAKCKAILMAVRWGQNHGLEDVIVESDSQVIISRLTVASMFLWDLDSILGDVIEYYSSFNSVNFSHVERVVTMQYTTLLGSFRLVLNSTVLEMLLAMYLLTLCPLSNVIRYFSPKELLLIDVPRKFY